MEGQQPWYYVEWQDADFDTVTVHCYGLEAAREAVDFAAEEACSEIKVFELPLLGGAPKEISI